MAFLGGTGFGGGFGGGFGREFCERRPFTGIGVILVLFILLVIIGRSRTI